MRFLGLGYVRLPISIYQLFFGNIFGNKCRSKKIKYAPDGAKFAPPLPILFLIKILPIRIIK